MPQEEKIKTSKAYHPPYQKFQGFLKEKRITLKEIGNLLGGQTIQTISAKNNGQADYKMNEVNNICDRLGISADIFRRYQ